MCPLQYSTSWQTANEIPRNIQLGNEAIKMGLKLSNDVKVNRNYKYRSGLRQESSKCIVHAIL